MDRMTHRERALNTFQFKPVDRICSDLMESFIWEPFREYFYSRYGFTRDEQIVDHLDTDFRWIYIESARTDTVKPPKEGLPADWYGSYSDALFKRPLGDVHSPGEVDRLYNPDPAWFRAPDFKGFREKWPDHAMVFLPGFMPLFCGACDAFGMEEAMVKLVTEPEVFEAFVIKQNEFYMEILRNTLKPAEGLCDICWLADDYASSRDMMIDPQLWRKRIKPYLAQQVRLVKEHGMRVLFHSCGAVRSILPDLIDIGVDAHLVFQTTAAGMDPESIAQEFGGKMVFYGGIDAQGLLTRGSPEEIEREVRRNVEAFSRCGGYVVANSHHGLPDIRAEKIEVMCRAAHKCTF